MKQPPSGYTALLGLLVCAFCAFIARHRNRRLPPGPRGLPLLGNIFGIPGIRPWITYHKWTRQCNSDLVHLKILRRHIVVVNSARAMKELFEKRASIYSNRPQSVMMNELSGIDKSFGQWHIGTRWREHRKMFMQHFRPAIISSYHAKMVKEARVLLKLLHDEPDKFLQNTRYMAGALILGVVYALDINSRDDPAIAIAQENAHAFSEMTGNVYLVDLIPSLKYLPAWFPGAGFKRQAARWRRIVDSLYQVPYAEVKANVEQGFDRPCIASALLANADPNGNKKETEEAIMKVAGVAYAAGADTTVLSVQNFILAMVLYPEVQNRAYTEIDHVIGRDRLPEFTDRDSLPYITAVAKEVLRWRVPIPLGVPHESSVDDVYDGYRIPAGSMVIGNSWAVLHDEARYPDPETFDPSRFLTTDGQLNADIPDPFEAFGHGRRRCPGRYFAMDTLWITAATILAALEIRKPLDDTGKAKIPSADYGPGIFSFPLPFEAEFVPRYAQPASSENFV